MAAGNGFQVVIPYAFNASVVVVILFVLLRKPTKKFVFQRHERMKDLFESAKKAKLEAEQALSSAQLNLEQFKKNEQQLFSKEVEKIDREIQELKTKNEDEIKRLKVEADRLVKNELESAGSRVVERFVKMITDATSSKLESKLQKDDHVAIINDARSNIEAGV
ncbi:MAG: hypothetical protein M9962_04895 [Oligoflexia bacterium]|nr:hypothetical protein [Oligoflexia bacterium]